MVQRLRGPAPQPRPAATAFTGVTPRYWLGGDPVATHLVNGVNLLFPAGERFFIRAVAHYTPQITDSALLTAIKGFSGQEAQHALAHERFFTVLEDQGYDLKPFLQQYERIAYGLIERYSPWLLRLATTAALEHFTALLAEEALTRPALDAAAPDVRDLLRWHAAEEIEHKDVAYDVFRTVSGHYGWRMAGLFMAVVTLGPFWAWATAMLHRQDRQLGVEPGQRNPEMRAYFAPRILIRGILAYLKPGFHPNDRDNRHLADSVFAR